MDIRIYFPVTFQVARSAIHPVTSGRSSKKMATGSGWKAKPLNTHYKTKIIANVRGRRKILTVRKSKLNLTGRFEDHSGPRSANDGHSSLNAAAASRPTSNGTGHLHAGPDPYDIHREVPNTPSSLSGDEAESGEDELSGRPQSRV